MLSLKYIRIRTERPVEERLASIWHAACSELGIPCILVYLQEDAAYISVNLKHLYLAHNPLAGNKEMQEKLQQLQVLYTGASKGFWKHNECYYTFDAIPRPTAQEAAIRIFETLAAPN